MIDFRYHIVSLISVFLALALGIILGAGPLQNSIADALTGQVDQIRSERNQLRSDLDKANSQLKDDSSYIEAGGTRLVTDTLTGRNVAVIDVNGANSDRDKDMSKVVEAAGGKVVAHVSLTSAWTDDADASIRETLATGLAPRLGDLPANATSADKLGRALAVALTQAGSTPQTRSATATDVESQLVKVNLIDTKQNQTVPADMILLVDGTTPTSGGTPTVSATAKEDSVVDSQMALAVQCGELAVAAEVAGPSTTSGDLISTIASDKTASSKVATVSGVENAPGMINVPLALQAAASGDVGRYGFENGATVMPAAPTSAPTATPTGGS